MPLNNLIILYAKLLVAFTDIFRKRLGNDLNTQAFYPYFLAGIIGVGNA